tara:strand:- start:850 stop:1164 length:315 start_codon:yes stop_codon:yes gene_type:complete
MNKDPHAVAASLFGEIRDATTTKELDTTLTRATHFWVIGSLLTGTVEACAYRAADKARELQAAYEANRIEKHAPDVEDYAAMRHAHKVKMARYKAGMGRKGLIT